MSQFTLHFFKEKSRSIDLDRLIEFFEEIDGFDIHMDEKSVRFEYRHPQLGYQARFQITPKSRVPNISRLSPQYLEINFHLELPILTPVYAAKTIISMCKKLSDTFNLYVYSELFSDVLPFNFDTVVHVFLQVRRAFLEKYPEKQQHYFFMKESKLSAVLRYLEDAEKLEAFYASSHVVVPEYSFIKDENDKPYLAFEWKEGQATIFPPFVDYILYRHQDQSVKVISYTDFLDKAGKFLSEVPGFLQGTKVVSKKYQAKANKVARKGKFHPISKQFSTYRLHQLLD